MYEPLRGEVGPPTPILAQPALFCRLSDRILVGLDGTAFLEPVKQDEEFLGLPLLLFIRHIRYSSWLLSNSSDRVDWGSCA